MASVRPPLSPIRLQGSDYFLPTHAPIRAMPTVLDGSVPLHDHDFMEVALVLGGTGTHRTIYGDQPIARGDVFVLRPGAWHAYVDAAELQLYELRFGIELLSRELAWTRDDPAIDLMFWAAPLSVDRRGVLHVRLAGETLDRAWQVADEIHRMVTPEVSRGRAEEVGRLLLFVSELSHAVAGQLQAVRKGKPEPHQAVSEGIRLMEEDIRRDWTLPELARRLGVDKSYLVRLFRAHTGSPPMNFLAKLRAERAALLLLRTARDVGVIGEQVGWGDPNYFARRFKAHFGLSATKYRDKFEQAMRMPVG
jgi:AraC family L-rhamnose operon transcriptional activator RhaR